MPDIPADSLGQRIAYQVMQTDPELASVDRAVREATKGQPEEYVARAREYAYRAWCGLEALRNPGPDLHF